MLAVITLAVSFSSVPFFVPNAALVLVVLALATAGSLIGWMTKVAVPVWLLIALPSIAVACNVLGWGQYNDDGDSGPLFNLVVLVPGLLAAAALIAGIAAGAGWRPTAPQPDRPLDAPQRL